jgi:DNA repair protein RecO (recombination protein O)
MPEFRSIRVHAIVLRHADWGEADRLVTLFTREQGKIRAVVKGARKITSRKAGHLEPFTQVKLQLSRGRDLFIVTQADTVEAYLPLRESLALTGYASYVVELLDRFVYEEESANPTLFRLLADTLKRLAEDGEPWLAVRFYEMRLLDFLGFRPQLFRCANCGREIKAEEQFFSYNLGGVICPRCGQGLPHLKPVSVEALKYLRHFQRSVYREAARARPTQDVRTEAENITQGYFTYLLERELNSPGFLKSIKAVSEYKEQNIRS